MGDLTRNLSRSEFECECGCGFNIVDFKLIDVLQSTADHFASLYGCGIKIIITGGNRCEDRNEYVQKHYNPRYVPFTSKSKHMKALAADFKLFIRHNNQQIDPEKVANYLEEKYPNEFGIGRYDNRTHFDSRDDGPARWRG